MSLTIDDNVAELLTDRLLNKQPVNEWAIKGLERGFDSKNLRMLASMLPIDAPSEGDDRFRRALSELGWDKIPLYVYAIHYARMIAQQAVADTIDPLVGSNELYHLLQMIDARSELSGWYYIEDEIIEQNFNTKTGQVEYRSRPNANLISNIKRFCEDFLRKTSSNLGGLPETTFDQAEALFCSFLKENGVGVNLRWVFREDVLAQGGNLAIRDPLPDDNREIARQCFDFGKQRRLGLGLHALYLLNGDPCCYVRLPEDEADAQSRLMSNQYVKFSFAVHMPSARAIKNPLIWKIKKLFESKKGFAPWLDDIPSREMNIPDLTRPSAS